MRLFHSLPSLAVALAIAAPLAHADERLIVRFRDSNAAKALVAPSLRVSRLAADAGVSLAYERDSVVGAKLVRVDDAAAAAARLAGHPDVEYAIADRRMQAQLVPNDEFIEALGYLTNGPASISAFAAWDITTGSASTVVAVLDTGYRPHADLVGRILPGYDFVTQVARANDGNGRDPDASDPGDWFSAADKASGQFSDGCRIANSSWHGTSVIGIVAANSNNRQWGTGIDWAAKVLPVRVLGKCDGSFVDIMEGVAWASGLAVPGVPANPTPAQVVNLSLGGEGACSDYEKQIFAAALAHGVTRAITVAAGNANADVATHSPASCPGVLAVTSTNSFGNKANYSNYGALVALSAPGGDNPQGGAEGIFALSNTGATVPVEDGVRNIDGTSFAAPMVAGVASLMLGVAPKLTADQVRSILTSTAKPFPPGSNCTTSICGAGIVDAYAAVLAAKAIGGNALTALAVEYYNASLDHYFITDRADEIAKLDAGTVIKGWTRTGQGFNVYPSAQLYSSPVCRFYIPPDKGNSHFYGRGTSECDTTAAKNPTFVNEDSQFFFVILPTAGVCPAGTTVVYRVFSDRADANHRYTTSRAIRDQMVALRWTPEGDGPDYVVMCSPN